MNELALFAGAGGGILGGKLLGWRTVCAVEWEPYAAGVLAARQNDKVLEPFPIWDDVQTFDGTPWRGIVDVVSGGFPCQDISSAGKGAGIDGERSSMWKHMARVVCEVRPEWVFVENSPMLVSRGLGTVLRDLAEIGFDAAWTVLSAADVGAPHLRERIWIVAHSGENGRLRGGVVPDLDRTQGAWRDKTKRGQNRNRFEILSRHRKALGKWLPEPEPYGVADGVACQVERLAATGNGQVPRVAAAAFAILAEQLMTPNPISATPESPNYGNTEFYDMTTTPQAALLSDDEIERHFENNKSVPGRELRRLIGRSIEAAILAKLQATQAEPVQEGELTALPHDGWPARFRCDSCDGNGEIGELISMGHFQPPERQTCPDCGGRGWSDEGPAFNADHMRDYARAVLSARKPLTDEQIEPMFKARNSIQAEGTKDQWYWYAWGVSDGEQAHGIGLEVKP